MDSVSSTLARASVATPLSLLVFIAAAAIALLVPHPSLAEISAQYQTILTPRANLLALYWLVLLVFLLATAFRIPLAKSDPSRRLIASGLGIRLAGALLLLAFWVLFWTLRLFLVAEILLLTTLVLAGSVWATLLLSQPEAGAAPLDYLTVHVPVRMLVVVLFSVDIWHQGLLALGWYRYVGPDEGHRRGKWEGDHAVHSWIAFGVIAAVALVNAGITFAFTDVTWGLCAIYLSIALAANSEGKPPQVYVTLILSAALVFVALTSSLGWNLLKKDQEGAIRLAEEEQDEIAVQRARDASSLPADPADPVNRV